MIKKILFFIIVLVTFSCSQEKDEAVMEEPNVDKGLSSFADSEPNNDVMLQAFWWDSYLDNKISLSGSLYNFVEEKLVELSNANIDVIWLPPPSEGEGMGYHPRELFNFNSNHGSEDELKSLLQLINNRKMHGMADLVLNHRIGTATWTDFTNPSWPCDAICSDDEGNTNPLAFGTRPCGDNDEGEQWEGARDLNHKSHSVQTGIKDYLSRLQELGFDSWRYDFVKGFPPKYVGEYNSSAPYYYSVGEYWDGNLDAIKYWIDGTDKTTSGVSAKKSSAFDFVLKYKLREAIVNLNYSVLNNSNKQFGLSSSNGYGDKSVTFLDNHDTGCINRSDCDNLFSNSTNQIRMGYAYLLTHPGIPMIWSYHYFFQDQTGELKKDINEFILLRKELLINANSLVEVLETNDGSSGLYVAKIDNKLLLKMGYGTYNPETSWKLKKSGIGYSIWTL
ncbi:alpha-amylase family glycosyl hydrolase [Maribacter sp. CXY002]|uniref:alpha-amylase family glycosyl hydrolase n=1 Tax=Maribacter luteocoastalis TaxID=3407671 RepID=UPI003B6818C9